MQALCLNHYVQCSLNILHVLYSFLPFLGMLFGAAIIVIICVRHLPQAAMLDVERLPQEKHARVKKFILEKQFFEALQRHSKKYAFFLKPLRGAAKILQRIFRTSVTKTYIGYAKAKARIPTLQSDSAPPEALATLLKDAETALLQQSFQAAEQKYIEVIRLSPRNVEAYRGLARVYFEKQQFAEAEELYLFILKLDGQDVRALNRLGMIAVMREKWQDAVRYFKRVVELDPKIAIRHYDLGVAYHALGKSLDALRSFERAVALEELNPKYLDAYLGEAILLGNRILAEAILSQLKLANPENKKLSDLEKRIQDLK